MTAEADGERIERGEARFHGLTVDAVGRLFTWRGRLFRAINPAAARGVRELFACGLLDELMRERLFVRSRVTGYRLEGCGLVVEHQRIAPLVYPFEWSFSMLKDAALAVLALNTIARRYGYRTADCHGFNVCFDGTIPLFVDLGSFEQAGEGETAWSAYEEFLASYEYPLRIWSGGNAYFARRALLGCGLDDRMTHASYFLYKLPWLRWLGQRHLAFVLRSLANAAVLTRDPRRIAAFLRQADWRSLRLRDLARLQAVDFEALAKRVRRIRPKAYATAWGGYQAAYRGAGGTRQLPGRFERVAGLLESFGVKTVVELAGNQGALSRRIARIPGLEKVACTDADENAVDRLYLDAGRTARIVPAVLDFMFPMTNYAGNAPPSERFRADAVVALAVTHHLLLGQRLSLEHVLATLRAFANRYVLVEFMPLGLHDGKGPVEVPSWYTIGWFRRAFETAFEPVLEDSLEENRVLFVGKVRKGRE